MKKMHPFWWLFWNMSFNRVGRMICRLFGEMVIIRFEKDDPLTVGDLVRNAPRK